MDARTDKVLPMAPPPYGWEGPSNIAVTEPTAPYPTCPGPNAPRLQMTSDAYDGHGSQQRLLQGHSQYEYYQGYQACSQYPPQAQSGYKPVPSYPVAVGQPRGQPSPSVVIVGGCPACRIGVLEDDFTCFGVCCAIFCFPIGILCCLAMRQRRCSTCGANFS